MRLTLVLHPGTERQTDVVVEGTAATIGSAERAHVRVDGLEPLHATVEAKDGRVTLQAHGPVVAIGDAVVPRYATRPLRRDDVVRLGPACTLRVDVPFTSLALRPAALRGLYLGVPLAAIVFILAASAPSSLKLIAALVLCAELGVAVALGACVELWVSRLGPTPARRTAAFLGNTALFAAACVALRVNLEYMSEALTAGPEAAAAAAHDALVGSGTGIFVHRALTLGLVVGVVTELRWWRSHPFVTLALGAAAGALACLPAGLLVDALGLPEHGGSTPPQTGMGGGSYMFGTLIMAFLLGLTLHVVQRFGPGAER